MHRVKKMEKQDKFFLKIHGLVLIYNFLIFLFYGNSDININFMIIL